MDEQLPSSLAEPRALGAPTIAFGGGLVVFQLMLLCSASDLWLPLVTVLPSVIGAAFVTRALTEQRWKRASGFAISWLAGQFLLSTFVLLSMGETTNVLTVAFAVTVGFSTIMIAAAAPVALGGVLLGRRKDLEAGDLMLGVCGAWLSLSQTAILALLKELPRSAHYESGGLVLFGILGMMLGVGAFGVFGARTIARRRWCARLERGELHGWRVRSDATRAELEELPPLFGSPRGVSGVVERVEPGSALYRSGLVARPLASLRVRGRAAGESAASDAPGAALTP